MPSRAAKNGTFVDNYSRIYWAGVLSLRVKALTSKSDFKLLSDISYICMLHESLLRTSGHMERKQCERNKEVSRGREMKYSRQRTHLCFVIDLKHCI